jgi:hypothetical protein
VVWIKSIATYGDAGIAKGFWKRALEYFIGPDERRIIRPHGVLFDDQERLFIADPGAGLVHFMDLKKGRYTLIGGEGNGGVIYPAVHCGRDAATGGHE